MAAKSTTAKKKRRLANQATRLAREIVLARDPACWKCGGPSDCWAHVIRRSRSVNLKWDTSNQAGMCQSCHYSITNAREGEAYHWIKHFGLEWYEGLMARADEPHPSGYAAGTVGRLEWIVADLEAQRAVQQERGAFGWTNP